MNYNFKTNRRLISGSVDISVRIWNNHFGKFEPFDETSNTETREEVAYTPLIPAVFNAGPVL